MKTHTKVLGSASSKVSISPKSLLTALPLSEKYLLNNECASISTNLLAGNVFRRRMDSCWDTARQSVVLPVPGGPKSKTSLFQVVD